MAVPRRTLTLLRRLANQVGGTTDDTVRALARSWVSAWDRLTPAWQQAIAAIVAEYQRTGLWPPAWRIARIEAVARAQDATRQSLTLLLTEASRATRAAAADVSGFTAAAQPAIIASQTNGSALPVAAAVAAAALAARQSRIGALHSPLTAATSAAVDRVFRAPATTTSSTLLQRRLLEHTRAGFDTGLIRAATIARTELVDTYRTTAALVDSANAETLSGWCWFCECDLRSCPACWAMHGQTFPLSVPGPEGHGGCRCTRLPLAAGLSLPSAEARFRRLPRRDQIRILGPGRWGLWHTGAVTWADLAVRRANRGWRDTHVPRPVGDLKRLAGIR